MDNASAQVERLVESVANALGWDTRTDWGTIEVAIPAMGGFHTSIKPMCNLVYIAAYAKAEMANIGIGYEQCASVSHAAAFIGWGSSEEPRWKGNQHTYDPTDPVSEAIAILRCCADALRQMKEL